MTTDTKSDGVFAEMQIISYNFIILQHIQINSQFRKILMLKVRLSFFWGQSVYYERSFISKNWSAAESYCSSFRSSIGKCGTLHFELHSGNMKSELIKKITSLDTSRRSKLQNSEIGVYSVIFFKIALKFTHTLSRDSWDFLISVILMVLFEFQTFNFILWHGKVYVCHSNSF